MLETPDNADSTDYLEHFFTESISSLPVLLTRVEVEALGFINVDGLNMVYRHMEFPNIRYLRFCEVRNGRAVVYKDLYELIDDGMVIEEEL